MGCQKSIVYVGVRLQLKNGERLLKYQSNLRVFVTGKTGWGKTYFVMHTIFPKLTRVLVHDRKHRLKGHPTVYCHTLEDVVNAWQKGKNKIVYQPYNPSESDFDALCHIIFMRGNYVLIVDEVKSYTQVNKIPYWLDELYRLGRERNTGVIALSQRPMYVHNTLISESDYIIAFHLELEGDRKKIAETVGKEAMKLGELGKFHYLEYNPESGCVWRKPI